MKINNKWLKTYLSLKNKDPRFLIENNISYIYIHEYGEKHRVTNVELYKKSLDEILGILMQDNIKEILEEIPILDLEDNDKENIYLIIKFLKDIKSQIE